MKTKCNVGTWLKPVLQVKAPLSAEVLKTTHMNKGVAINAYATTNSTEGKHVLRLAENRSRWNHGFCIAPRSKHQELLEMNSGRTYPIRATIAITDMSSLEAVHHKVSH